MSDWNEVDLGDLQLAIKEFRERLPGWWFTLGVCSVSSHASCGPDAAGVDAALCEHQAFGSGFDADWSDGSMAHSLRDVMQQALKAKEALQ